MSTTSPIERYKLLIRSLAERLQPHEFRAEFELAFRDVMDAPEEYGRGLIHIWREVSGVNSPMEGMSRSDQNERHSDFLYVLMHAYPFGSIREEGRFRFMGFRKEILSEICASWNGDPSEDAALGFLIRALSPPNLPPPDDEPLADEEKEMVLAIIRNRLKDQAVFTEPVLRRLINRMIQNRKLHLLMSWEKSMLHTLIVARARNAGIESALVDIQLREAAEAKK